jgi:hypothetical protein
MYAHLGWAQSHYEHLALVSVQGMTVAAALCSSMLLKAQCVRDEQVLGCTHPLMSLCTLSSRCRWPMPSSVVRIGTAFSSSRAPSGARSRT